MFPENGGLSLLFELLTGDALIVSGLSSAKAKTAGCLDIGGAGEGTGEEDDVIE